MARTCFIALFVAIFQSSGNFHYQWLTGAPDWAAATERSFFGAWALLTFVTADALLRLLLPAPESQEEKL